MYDEYTEDEIISIEECPEEMETMDIEVDGDHLFDANDILTHNSAYDNNKESSLVNMSESMKKVEHSDFVGILRNIEQDVNENDDVRFKQAEDDFVITIKKNRSGPKNIQIKLKSKFSRFKIYDKHRIGLEFENNLQTPKVNTNITIPTISDGAIL